MTNLTFGLEWERIPLEERPLAPMQQRFVEEYIADSTTIKGAAIRAGYSLSTAQEQGSKLMADPRVRKMLQEAQDRAINKIGVTAERIIQELWKVAGANPGDIVQLKEDGEYDIDPSKVVGEVTVTSISGNGKKVKSVSTKTVKPSDKLAALSQLSKILNLVPKEEINVKHELSFAEMVQRSAEIPLSPQLENQSVPSSS